MTKLSDFQSEYILDAVVIEVTEIFAVLRTLPKVMTAYNKQKNQWPR